MIALARERGIAGRGVDAATRLAAAAARVWEKPLPMNVSMAIAATLRDADVPAAIIRGVPILARDRRPDRPSRRRGGDADRILHGLASRGGDPLRRARSRSAERMSLTEPEIEAAPWEGQAAADEAPYRRQIAYLFERSRFYRDKLGQAGFKSADAVGGLADIARLPFTEKDELRASRSADEPIGAHCAATRDEIVRIYSTSGTTGTPSYIPLTAARRRGVGAHVGAQLRRLRRQARRPHRLDLQCRTVRRRRGARRLRAARPLPHSDRQRTTPIA